MTPRNVENGIETRKKLLKGAMTLARAVAVTYGPAGRTAMLDRTAGLLSTRDGVTVAREVDLPDPVENLGAQILKDASVTVNDEVGDGTTTTVVLAAEFLEAGHKLVVAGYDPVQLAAGIQAAAKDAAEIIEAMALPVSDQESLETVARLASNGDIEVAKFLAEACMAVGRDGTIVIEDGHGMECQLDLKEGMEIDRGALNPAFLTGERLERTMEGPLVAVINRHLRTFEDVKGLLENASQFPGRELLVVALGVDGDAMSALYQNHSAAVVKSCPIHTPGFGPHKSDWLKDIAAISGATFVDPEAGADVADWQSEWFGSLRQAVVTSKKTTLQSYDENHDDLDSYMAGLRTRMESSASEYDRDKLKERLAKLAGGLAVLRIGGVTEPAMKERRARVEDALGAVRAALKGGIVPGAGTAFLNASVAEVGADKPESFKAGWKLCQQALRKPIFVLAANAGQSGEMAVHYVTEALKKDPTGWHGWDVLTGKVRDLHSTPMVANPALVDRSSLLAAASVASTLLTVEVSISLVRDHQTSDRS